MIREFTAYAEKESQVLQQQAVKFNLRTDFSDNELLQMIVEVATDTRIGTFSVWEDSLRSKVWFESVVHILPFKSGQSMLENQLTFEALDAGEFKDLITAFADFGQFLRMPLS